MSVRDEEENARTGAAAVTTSNRDKVDVEESMDKYQLTEYTAYGRKFRMTKKMANSAQSLSVIERG